MQAIKKVNENVDSRLVLQMVIDNNEDFYFREYYLISRGKEQFLLLNSNEEYFENSFEIIRTKEKFLRGFNRSPFTQSHMDILPKYTDYEIIGGDLNFLELLELDFVTKIEGYHENCFDNKDKQKALSFTNQIPLLKEKARNNIGQYSNYYLKTPLQ